MLSADTESDPDDTETCPTPARRKEKDAAAFGGVNHGHRASVSGDGLDDFLVRAQHGLGRSHRAPSANDIHAAGGQLTSSPFATLPPLIYIGPEKTGTTTMARIDEKTPYHLKDTVGMGGCGIAGL